MDKYAPAAGNGTAAEDVGEEVTKSFDRLKNINTEILPQLSFLEEAEGARVAIVEAFKQLPDNAESNYDRIESNLNIL